MAEDGEIIVPKPGQSQFAVRSLVGQGKGAFFMTGLNKILRDKGISHLIVCGVTTEAENRCL